MLALSGANNFFLSETSESLVADRSFAYKLGRSPMFELETAFAHFICIFFPTVVEV